MRKPLAATVSLCVLGGLFAERSILAQDARADTAAVAQVLAVEDEFRVAKLRNDVQSLDRILDESFVETNQNGNRRTKKETIDLFRSFRIQSLITDSSNVRLAGNSALVTGSQTEVNGSGTDRMLFTRVYIRSGDGWRLAASSQFRNPKPVPFVARPRDDQSVQVSEIEERFRVAKLGNDVQSLDQILDEAFVETNQNGNSRTKSETIDLFRTFPIKSLVTDDSTIRLTAGGAVVTGAQTEVNASGTDRMLFTRVYVKSGDRWRLLASSQFRNPQLRELVPR